MFIKHKVSIKIFSLANNVYFQNFSLILEALSLEYISLTV